VQFAVFNADVAGGALLCAQSAKGAVFVNLPVFRSLLAAPFFQKTNKAECSLDGGIRNQFTHSVKNLGDRNINLFSGCFYNLFDLIGLRIYEYICRHNVKGLVLQFPSFLGNLQTQSMAGTTPDKPVTCCFKQEIPLPFMGEQFYEIINNLWRIKGMDRIADSDQISLS